jgi:hypothetical protein
MYDGNYLVFCIISIRSAGFCVGVNALPGYTKEWTFLEEMKDYGLLSEGAAVCSSLH